MKPTLLVAEADAELRDLYHKVFSDQGYEVGTAADGLTCLEQLRRRMPSVLLLDFGLLWGGSDGVLACLEDERAACGVLVVLTGPPSWRPKVAQEGPSRIAKFLAKPFSLNSLLESVRAAVDLRGSSGFRSLEMPGRLLGTPLLRRSTP
jgi:DNA-binding response OmpR family regulator